MNKYKTLIILDWDDTLFPTSWIMKNDINLTDKNMQYQFLVYFSRLDTLLYELLTKMSLYGQIIIITNAALKWVTSSSNILPNTQRLLKNKATILSARDFYQEKFPDKMYLWKKMLFHDTVSKYFNNHLFQNILSVGDAEYEFNATVDLYNEHSVIKNRLLKTVRLMQDPSFESLIDQLEVLDKNIHVILIGRKHFDLKFKNI